MGISGKIRILVGVLLILAGPGAATGLAQDLIGRYVVCQMTAGETLLYTLEFDGSGVVTDVALISASFEIVGGDLDPDTASQFIIGIPEGAVFSVSADGELVFSGLDFAGMVSIDGRFISFVRTTPGAHSFLAFGIRTASGLSDATLLGDYFIHVLELEVVGRTVLELVSTAYVIDATFNGMGTMRGDIFAGTPVSGEPVVAADYQVGPNGQLAIDFTALGMPDNGMVSADAAAFAFADTAWGDGNIRLAIGLKKPGKDVPTDVSFASDYFFTELLIDGPVVATTAQFRDFFGELTFDGFANFQLTQLETTCKIPPRTEASRVNLFTDGLFEANGLAGTLLGDGQLFVSSRIESGTSGMQVGVAKHITIVSPRRNLDVEPEGGNEVCFIGAARSIR